MAEIIKIGRNHNNKNLLTNPQDPTVSKRHLQLFIDDDYNVFVTDLNSANGTYVNNNLIKEPKLLEEGDMLSAGNCIVKWAKYIDSLKSLETKIEEENDDDSINESDEVPLKIEDESTSWWKSDDEYISGEEFIKRFFVGCLLAIVGAGLYLCAVTAHKRASSLKYDTAPIYTIFGFLFAPLCVIAILQKIPVLLIANVIFLTNLWFRNGKRPTVLDKKLNSEIDLKKSENIVNNDSWSREDRLAFYATLSELAGADGIDPNEESIIASYLSAIGFNPTDNYEFEDFRVEAVKILKDDRYKIISSFSKSKKQLLADAMKHVIMADEKISEEELLAKGLIEIMADLPKSNLDEKDMKFIKNKILRN